MNFNVLVTQLHVICNVIFVQLLEEAGTLDLEVEDDELGGRGSRRQKDDSRPSAERAWRQQGLQSGQKSRLNQQMAFQRKISWKTVFAFLSLTGEQAILKSSLANHFEGEIISNRRTTF